MIDIIEFMISKSPKETQKTQFALIKKLCMTYGESLQSYMTAIFVKAIEHENPIVSQFMFFFLLNGETFVQNLVRENMPEDKKERLEVFMNYLEVKYDQMSTIFATKNNVEMLMENFTQACAEAWQMNRMHFMRQQIENHI